MFVFQSLSNTQENRVSVVCFGFSCSSLSWFTSTLRMLQGAFLRTGLQLQGSSASHPPSSRGRRVLASRRCAVRPVGVAARRRAPTAVNNGAGREEKGNLLGEAVRPAGGRASERGRREFTFAPVSARRGRRRRGRKSTEGAGRPARRSRPRAARGGIGARPRGAEPASLASEGNHGGRAPGGPPEQRRMPHEELPSLQRPRYGCECSGFL